MKIKERTIDQPASSMADIAFLLLVFFLLTTTIDKEKAIHMPLFDPDRTITIAPHNISTIYINGQNHILFDGIEVSLAEIENKVRDLVEKNQDLVFEVRASRISNFNSYISVLDQLKLAEAKKISVNIVDN